jgi:hypothetical protein
MFDNDFHVLWRPMGLTSELSPGHSLNFNFLILCSCAVPPKFYGISSHTSSINVCKYDFTKENKK